MPDQGRAGLVVTADDASCVCDYGICADECEVCAALPVDEDCPATGTSDGSWWCRFDSVFVPKGKRCHWCGTPQPKALAR